MKSSSPGDAGECVDEDAIARLDCLTVGCTRMVQETCTVPAATAIDDATVRQAEHERMAGLRSLACGSAPPAGPCRRADTVGSRQLATAGMVRRAAARKLHSMTRRRP